MHKKPTRDDWFNVASICGEWIKAQEELNDPSRDSFSVRVDGLIWNYYLDAFGWKTWQRYHKALDQATVIIDPIQPFNVACENRMFVALQLACERAGLCR